jgi:hypothetical protein
MRGVPKTVRTRADIESLMAFLGGPSATPDRIAWGIRTLQGLLATRQHYEFDRILANSEEPDGPEPNYRVVTDEGGDRRQNKLVDDPNARIYRLGLTDAEVEDWITTLESY